MGGEMNASVETKAAKHGARYPNSRNVSARLFDGLKVKKKLL
jgi:hypothetical protein